MDAVRWQDCFAAVPTKTAWDALLKPVSAAWNPSSARFTKLRRGEAVGYENGWIAPKRFGLPSS